MNSIDFRTRYHGDAVDLDVESFVRDLAGGLPDANAIGAGHAARTLELEPLTLDVEGEVLTLEVAGDGRLLARLGAGPGVRVALDRTAFSDLVQDVASAFGLFMTGRATLAEGAGADGFLDWEPVLRHLLDGRPVHGPGGLDFEDRHGRPLELRRSFSLEDDPADIGSFLHQAGYLHLTGVFSDDEMAAVAADQDEAMSAAERDDGQSWWARTSSEGWFPTRILGFNHRSPSLRELLYSERLRAIGAFTGDAFLPRDPDTTDAAEALFKKVGVVEGMADVSWHKDCSMGGHSRRCCSLTVGISVTGAGPESGELGVVAGSHRANLPLLGVEGVDLPRVPLPTRTGDVTVHCSCTLHMSRPPTGSERRVVYTGFDLAPRPGDRRATLDASEVRRERAALEEHGRRLPGALGSKSASHEL